MRTNRAIPKATSAQAPGFASTGAASWAATILVVEDEESVAVTLGAILEAEGYRVVLAASVPEALTCIDRDRFDAALLDLRVGGDDGLTLLLPLKEQNRDAVGIVLTGYGSLETAIQAMRAGADDFLLKPSDVDELKASIARAVHWRTRTDAHTAELERRELQLAEAQELAHLGSWEWDIEHNVVTWSDELYKILGLEPHELTASYEAFLKRIHPEDRDRLHSAVQSAIHTGQPFELEHRIVGQDGVVRILHSRGKVIDDTAGRPLRMFCTAQDVTERKEAEERVGVLEDLNRLTEEFIATASHDLKNPLTSIRGYTQLLLRRARGAAPDVVQLAKGLAAIESQTAAMTRLIDDLLDASRIEAGGLDLRTSACDLGDCLASVLALLSPRERQRVEVTLPRAPLAGQWEQNRIEQVLANLVGNALKYSPDTEPICVEVQRRAKNIELAISDRGMGIPSEELPRLFERFHRTPQARASALPGTGLGLYICSGIIAAHRGRIWAESSGPGQGATFRFTLPTEPSGLTPPEATE